MPERNGTVLTDPKMAGTNFQVHETYVPPDKKTEVTEGHRTGAELR